MTNYYINHLSALRLKKCYDIAPPRVQQYLKAEIDYIIQKISSNALVLELGCGYGRVLSQIANKGGMIIGIDNSYPNLILAKKMLAKYSNISLLPMDAINLAFRSHTFDCVICIQNGISAFHVNKIQLIAESIRVTKNNGYIFFSSYSEKFWKDRLNWFYLQADYGLIGRIDQEKTHDGTIICKDGFTASTISPEKFLSLTSHFNIDSKIVEIDNSSIFCEIKINKKKE